MYKYVRVMVYTNWAYFINDLFSVIRNWITIVGFLIIIHAMMIANDQESSEIKRIWKIINKLV